MDSIKPARPDSPECPEAEWAVADVIGILEKVLSSKQIAEKRAHAAVCAWCQWVRSQTTPVFKNIDVHARGE
jgi:hypothetical protein